MRIFKLFILLGIFLLSSCNHRPAQPKTVQKSAVTAVMKKSAVAIPAWLVGIWEGDYVESMTMHFVVIIRPDGTVTQTSSAKGEDTETLNGVCTALTDDDSMSVTFGEGEEPTIYYLDKSNKLLGVTENAWLSKK